MLLYILPTGTIYKVMKYSPDTVIYPTYIVQVRYFVMKNSPDALTYLTYRYTI